METRRLGTSGLTVSRLGLGSVKLGRNRDVKYPTRFELPSDAEVEALLNAAVEAGVVFWDTAPAYGTAEERLGPYVERWRQRLVVCSKAGEDYDDAGSHFDFSASHLRASVERSLRRLRTDHLDVLLLHSDGRDREILENGEAVPTLQALRDEGKVRAVGISAKTAEGIALAAEHLDVVMAPFSQGRTELGSALEAASAKGVGTIAIKILDQGHGATDAAATRRALEFVAGTSFVDVAVLGTRDPQHLWAAARVFGEERA